MTPPPLPPGVEGEAVAPDVHTGCDEPERDPWRTGGNALALAVALRGLRALKDKWSGSSYAGLDTAVADVTWLIDKIERAR